MVVEVGLKRGELLSLLVKKGGRFGEKVFFVKLNCFDGLGGEMETLGLGLTVVVVVLLGLNGWFDLPPNLLNRTAGFSVVSVLVDVDGVVKVNRSDEVWKRLLKFLNGSCCWDDAVATEVDVVEGEFSRNLMRLLPNLRLPIVDGVDNFGDGGRSVDCAG